MFWRKKRACGEFLDLTKVAIGSQAFDMSKEDEKIDTLEKHAQGIKVSHGKGYNNSGKKPRCGNAS